MHGLVGSWVSFNIFFNYLMCVRTQAGSTASVNNQDLLDAHPPPERWCTTCEKPKPALSHHCSVCGVCVLCMDHHCPWVNRCVGFYNYRYFYLFLFWLTIGCGWAVWFPSSRPPQSAHARSRGPVSIPKLLRSQCDAKPVPCPAAQSHGSSGVSAHSHATQTTWSLIHAQRPADNAVI